MTESKDLTFSEITNAIDSLEVACRFMEDVGKNPRAWKWIIIAIHGALYGFAISNLGHDNYDRVTFKNKNGTLKLIHFNQAIELCKQDKPPMIRYVNSKILNLTVPQKNSLHRIHAEFRNNFEHYIPGLWYIEVYGMPQIVLDALEVIEFLALKSGNLDGFFKQGDRAKVRKLVSQGKELLMKSQYYRETKAVPSK